MTTDRGSSHFASRNLESAGQIQGSSLAAALADIDRFTEQHMPPWSVIVAAARERLRLSRIPCETCGGTGNCGRLVDDFGYDDPVICGTCGGSGGVWDEGLTAVLQTAIWNGVGLRDPDESTVAEIVRVVLEVLDLYAKEATK